MPELPQMKALSERLGEMIEGSILARSTTIQFSAAKTYEPALESLHGSRVEAISSRAKYLVVDLGGPRLLLHLSQGGRVEIEDPPRSSRPKNGVVRLAFQDRPALFVREYGTRRKAGYWVLEAGDDGPLSRLGPDWGTQEFDAVLSTIQDRRRIHTMLRDQRTVAGVGRGYADDILHRAELSPYATPARFSTGDRRRLVSASHEVLDEALAKERARTGGLPPKLAEGFTIHGRHGSPCPRCGSEMKRVSFESYEITYCPPCQTDGRVLADRRLSRLIR